MESISERKNPRRKAEEFGNDLEAETQEEETETSTAAEDDSKSNITVVLYNRLN